MSYLCGTWCWDGAEFETDFQHAGDLQQYRLNSYFWTVRTTATTLYFCKPSELVYLNFKIVVLEMLLRMYTRCNKWAQHFKVEIVNSSVKQMSAAKEGTY